MTNIILSTLLLLALSEVTQAEPAQPLEMLKVLPVAKPAELHPLQPSGLAHCDGRLLMVSDRHNDRVFELVIGASSVEAKTFRMLPEIPKPELEHYDFGTQWWSSLSRRYDWEGISCDQDNLYLLSETLSQVLKLSSQGEANWLGDQAYLAGREKGLFEQLNAKGEGLAVANDHVYIAAERQPRGIVKFAQSNAEETLAFYLNGFPDLTQPEDFSGLLFDNQSLYTLERNHFQVCKRDPENMSVQRCWSYQHIEQDPSFAYQDQRFGKAEGISRQGQQLFIIFDNNEDARQQDPEDIRPQLMVFKLPQDW